MGAANAEEENMMHLRKTCSVAAAFSMLLRLKVCFKSAYGLTAARCQSYKPNGATKANEEQAQSANPPPETFNPFSMAKKGAGKNVVDTSPIAAAATSAAEVLDSGSSLELSAFYMELSRLAQDDPKDYAGWEGLEEAVSDGQDGGGGVETDAGSASNNNAPKERGKKRGLASSTGGARATKRRASVGDAVSTAKKRGGVGGRGKGVRTKGKEAKTQDGGRAQGGWRRLAIARRETTTTTRTGRRPGARLGVYLMVVLYLWSHADGDRALGGSLEERACRVGGWSWLTAAGARAVRSRFAGGVHPVLGEGGRR